MFFNMGDDMMNMLTVTVEQYIGNQLVEKAQTSLPQIFIQKQFMQLAEQVASYKGRQPIKIRMIRYEDSWNEFENKPMKLEYTVEYQNWED